MERIVPDELDPSETTGGETLELHIQRYAFAKENLIPGRVIDIACGVGYGTVLLAQSGAVSEAIGVDISSDAVNYAKQRYGGDRRRFVCSSALEFNTLNLVENVVSLETIEHVTNPERLVAHLASLLKPGGRLIASVPITPSVDANPHHVTNFTAKTFAQIGERLALKQVTSLSQTQPYDPFSILLRKERRAEGLRRSLPAFYMRHPSHLFLRLKSVVYHGFANKYLTVVWEK